MTTGNTLHLSEVTLDPAEIRHICFEGGHEEADVYTFEVLLRPRGSLKYTVSPDEYEKVQAFAAQNALQ
ncbi:hypothetical protein [Tellurirhabdus bombi]|uniref:hypothetical protein n=1 Tax=Tellurirhabdus bombi TaxID=2907205 RepID=UPI001F3F83E8|nr:hypothetical protein [Tellurirhabdus bombi]